MVHSRQYWCVFIFFIFVISEVHARQTQSNKANDDGAEDLPADFMSFVKGLDSMVFQTERKKNLTEVKHIQPPITNKKKLTKKLINRRRLNDNNIKASQTAAIRDILMLKLVSYYEDKYNVGRTKIYTTPQMLEPLAGQRRAFQSVSRKWNEDSIEKTAQLQSARKISDSLRYTENLQDTNALDQNSIFDLNQNSQDMKPHIEEVVGLR